MPIKQPDAISVPWVRSPRQMNYFATWTPGEVKLWTAINSAIQINTRNGRISVPALARLTGYSQRSIYRILRRLKTRGAVYAVVSPGLTAVYYLRLEYSGPRTTFTRDKPVTAHNKELNRQHQERQRPRYLPYRPRPVSPQLTANCYQSYSEYCATTNSPIPFDTWIPG